GKSTTFRMLCGLLPPSDGHLEVAGEDLRRAPARARAKIGYMAQKFSLYVNLTVAQNLNFFAGVYGLNGARKKERISWALEEFELESYKDTTSSELPLGYKQRLALAASLMHEPHILFLDEPTSGVDPIARREFWTRINTLAESGVTVLVTTHFMEEAEYCDRLAIMARGEVLALGAPDELKAKYLPDIKHATMEEVFISILEGRRENVH
ncbi:MAG: ABC transporter ATP-binding protein, partial [Dissulfurimicrobium sp.]